MAKVVYGFKDKAAAQRAAQYFGQNPQDQKQQPLYSEAVPARIRIVEIQEDMDGHGTELDDVQFPTSEVEIVRTTTNPQSLLSETTTAFHSVDAAPLEPTNYPAEAHVVAITDTFNQTFLVTPTPSEVFGTLRSNWSEGDTEAIVVDLDDGFTVNGDDSFYAYPAPTLAEGLTAGDHVSCRYIKSAAKWFFFKPTGGGKKLLNVYGPALAVSCSTVSEPVFYSEFAAGESVAASLSIIGISQSQVATGSTTSNAWVQFPTTFTTDDETVSWWQHDNVLLPGITAYYQTGGAGSYYIAPVAYYGKVISDGSNYYLPYYRTINGDRYWYCSTTGDYIYYTSQDGVSGWAIGQTLGKFLTSSDSEPFNSGTLADLMTQEGLAYSKPAWESSDEFGIYTANADAAALFPSVPSMLFGCGRWIGANGETPGATPAPAYFTHVCDGTATTWNGTYYVKAFQTKFSQINYYTQGQDQYYYIGSLDSKQGFYKSFSAPSTSSSVTFSYTPGTHPLKGTLSLTSSVEGTETWTMRLTTGAVAVYTCAEGATSMTFNSITSGDYYFRTISQQGNYWVAVGVDGTVGNLIFDGATLSKEAGNDFIFDHSFALTFDQYIQGSEKKKIWLCSPGVIS